MRHIHLMLCFGGIAVFCCQTLAQDPRTSIMAMDSDGKNLRQIVKLDDFPSVGSPDVSPDGKRIAFDGWREGEKGGSAQIFIFDIESSEIQQLGPGAMPTWSADGKYLSYSSYSPRGVMIRSADGVAKKMIDPRGWGIQWSPDGQKLAYSVRGSFVIYNLLIDEKKTIQPKPNEPYTQIYWNPDWSADSQKLCFKATRPDGEYETAILDISQEEPKLTVCFRFEKGYANEYAWHPTEDRITLVRYGKVNRLHEFKPEANTTSIEVPGQPEGIPTVGACWSSDGKTLYFLSRELPKN